LILVEESTMNALVLHRDDIPRDGNTYAFEGGRYG
jgi:hypothetical protein